MSYILLISIALLCKLELFWAFDLTILHTNDIHGRLEQFDAGTVRCSDADSINGNCFGGVARIQTVVKETRNEVDNVLLLDAGDQFQGTSWFQYYEGEAAAHFMNLLQYDTMTIGNHEFDIGLEKLARFIRNVTFPVVSANVDVDNEPVLQNIFTKSVVKEVNGEQIGIIGYTYTGTPEYAHLSVGNVIFESEIETVQTEVDRLMERGVNKIIALGHSGYLTDLEVAAKVRGVDIVVGGHSDTFLHTGEPPSTEQPVSEYPTLVAQEHNQTRKVLVVQSYVYGKYLGRLNVKFDDEGEITDFSGNAILLDNKIEQDADILNELSVWGAPVRAIAFEDIGNSNVQLTGDYAECCTSECSMANLLTDAYVRYHVPDQATDDGWTDVSIAMEACGNIRGSRTKGPLIFEDIVGVLPFRTTIDVVSMYGAVLKFFAESGVVTYDKDFFANGGLQDEFLQFSGLRITFDLSRDPYDRVVDLLALCADCDVPEYRPVEDTQVYKVIMSSYLYMFVKDSVFDHQTGVLDTDVVRQYIERQSPIVTGLDGRIRFVEPDPVPPTMMSEEKKNRKDNVMPPNRPQKLRKQHHGRN